MDYDFVKQTLAQLNLNLDLETINRVYKLIEDQVGQVTDPQINKNNLVYAYASIIVENEEIEAFSKFGSTAGLGLQHIINHIEPQTIEPFLNYLERVMCKCKQDTSNLANKVGRLRISYRLFTKYENILDAIAQKFGFQPSFRQELRKLIWTCYLLSKYTSKTQMELNEVINLLENCFSFIMTHIEKQKNIGLAYTAGRLFGSNFPQVTANMQSNSIVSSAISLVLSIREHCGVQQIDRVLANETHRRRFIDDMINECQKLKYSLDDPHLIDQIKYLRLHKELPLPPERVTHEVDHKSNFVNCKIDFDKLEIEEPKTVQIKDSTCRLNTDFSRFRPSVAVSPLIKRPQLKILQLSPMVEHKSSLTPISRKVSNTIWLNQFCQKLPENVKQRLLRHFEDVGEGAYESTKATCLQYLNKVIKKQTKENVEQKIQKVYNIFEHFLEKLCHSANTFLNELVAELSSDRHIKGLLCLVCCLYAYCNSTQPNNIRKYAEQFDASYLDVFMLISRVSKIDTMPAALKQYFCQLEKTILIVLIWEDSVGYNTITSNFEPKDRKLYKILEDRLQKYIYDRIYELHRIMSLEHTEAEKVKSIVAYVLNEKSIILKKNYIDQIILCSLFAVLKLKMKDSAPSLEEIFKKYNNAQLSFNSHKLKAYGHNQEQMNLLDFYNLTFKNDVREALGHDYISNKLLSTPLRQELANNSRNTPLQNILSHMPNTAFFSASQPLSFSTRPSQPNSYRSIKARQINQNMPILSPVTDNDSEDLKSSPKFPELGLKHKFSFAQHLAFEEQDSSKIQHDSATFGVASIINKNEQH